MNDFTFFVLHNQNDPSHVYLLECCLDHIRFIYPDIEIYVCITTKPYDISSIENKYTNVYFIEAELQNMHLFSGIKCILEKCSTSKYILIHDSIFLFKKLPIDKLNYDFLPLWSLIDQDIQEYRYDYLVEKCNCSENEKNLLKQNFQLLNKNFSSCFGPAFIGKKSVLHKIYEIFNVENNDIDIYQGKKVLCDLERFLPIVFYTFSNHGLDTLCGNIHLQPYSFHRNHFHKIICKTTLNKYLQIFKNLTKNYFIKIWITRV